MQKITIILSFILVILVSSGFAQTKSIAGTYTVSKNPKEIVRIKRTDKESYSVESNQGWSGTIFTSIKTRPTGIWAYSDEHKTKKLRGLEGSHSYVFNKDGSVTVVITPDDDKLPESVVTWYKINSKLLGK